MGKYFGTDGFRGEAGITLTADHAYKVGRFLGWYYNALRERNGNNEPARIVMENTISMMKRLNKKVLVEGVETKEQADYLIGQGVDYIQGYYYARPMDEAHLEELFRSQLEPVG